MFRCSKCIFYDSEGYRDMGCHIPECKLKITLELRKKNNKENYDLFSALIHNELEAENCKFFTYTCEIVDYILKEKGE